MRATSLLVMRTMIFQIQKASSNRNMSVAPVGTASFEHGLGYYEAEKEGSQEGAVEH